MIDTDKYEGHTPTPWTINVLTIGKDKEITAIVIESNMTTHSNCVLAEVEVENKYAEADAQLIADAPKLLAEVKRLRKQLSKAKNWVRDYLTDINGNYLSYENRVLHDDFTQQIEAKKND